MVKKESSKKSSKPDEVKDIQDIEAPKLKTMKTDDYNLEIVDDYDSKIDWFWIPNKDPNYEYRFLRDDPKNISIKTGNLLYQKGGWQICPKQHLIKIGITESLISKASKDIELSPDGLCRRGDTILCFMPKELYAKKEAYKQKQANDKMDAITRLIDKGDPNNPRLAGIGHGNMKGIQTAKDLNMK